MMINQEINRDNLQTLYKELLVKQDQVDNHIQRIEKCTSLLESMVFQEFAIKKLKKADKLFFEELNKHRGRPAPRWQLTFYGTDYVNDNHTMLIKMTKKMALNMIQIEANGYAFRDKIKSLEQKLITLDTSENYVFVESNRIILKDRLLTKDINHENDIESSIDRTYITMLSFDKVIETLRKRIERLSDLFIPN